MGQVVGRCRELKTKIRELEEEREGAKRLREAESRAFAGREEEWRRERRRLLLEAARLRSRIKEVQQQEEKKKKKKTTPPPLRPKAEAVSAVSAATGAAGIVVVEKEEEKKRMREEEAEKAAREQQQQQEVVVERMKEEQRRREEAVEKWKQLYLAIKAELDDLIQRTHHQGERFCWGAAGQQQGMIEALQKELKAREETVESLRLKISSMEKEGVRRDREIDILRQSLRILSYSKRNHRGSIRRSLPRGLLHM